MPRKQVYGKQTHAYSYSKFFDSPRKARPIVDVLEIADEFEGLGISSNNDEQKTTQHRLVLEPVASNRQSRKPEDQKKKSQSKPASISKSEAKCIKDDLPQCRPGTNVVEKPSSGTENDDSKSDSTPASQDVQAEELQTKEQDIYERHTAELLQYSSRPLTSFETWSDQLSSFFSITKIAEASFGEVYRLSLLEAHAKLSKTDESVLKIISLKPPPSTIKGRKLSKAAKSKLENMSDPADVRSEVRLLQRMTCIPGFTNFRDLTILKGRPGQGFINAWKSWNQNQINKGKERSVFPDPAKKTSYAEDQLWAVVEMQDAGTDLENTKVDNVWLIWDIFWNVVLSIGKGEEGAKFEHRDLHLGNICVSNRCSSQSLDEIDESQLDLSKKLGFTGAATTIIDYTLSRAEMSNMENATTDDEADIAYLDLEKDQAVFLGDGDVDYQYEIYRHMRSAMYLDDPLADIHARWDEAEASQRTWRGYHPQTNLVWLHFVLHQLSQHVYWPSLEPLPKNQSPAYKRSVELESALQKVSDLLEPERLPTSGLRCAADLVALALSEKWLDVEDVLGKKGGTKSSKRKTKTVARKAASYRTRP